MWSPTALNRRPGLDQLPDEVGSHGVDVAGSEACTVCHAAEMQDWYWFFPAIFNIINSLGRSLGRCPGCSPWCSSERIRMLDM